MTAVFICVGWYHQRSIRCIVMIKYPLQLCLQNFTGSPLGPGEYLKSYSTVMGCSHKFDRSFDSEGRWIG